METEAMKKSKQCGTTAGASYSPEEVREPFRSLVEKGVLVDSGERRRSGLTGELEIVYVAVVPPPDCRH
jgi:hypothetical protein